MFKNKYSNILTVILILAIVAIIVIIAILVNGVYKKYKNNKDAALAISNFQNNISNESETEEVTQSLIEQNIVVGSEVNEGGTQKKGVRKVTYYNNFVMIGYIEIPKINIRYPILEEETVASLEQSVAVRYPSHANLNEKGNVVIVGHNYRNGMFFSNLKKVSIGDKIKITDTNNRTLTYTVYEVYETTPEDVEYITRNVGDNTEITLATCTDNSSARIIVKAKV